MTVSQDISLEDGSVEVVTSELDPDLSLAILLLSSDEVEDDPAPVLLLLFLLILWTRDASWMVCNVSE